MSSPAAESPRTSSPEPEQYFVPPSPHCPSNILPILVYRGVLPEPYDEENTSEYLQRHGWVKKGTWGTILTRHYHPNTHECYGVFQGSSDLIFGEGGADIRGSGVRCHVNPGDVVVIPAGISHASVEEDGEREKSLDKSDRYRYVGVYPEGAPKWRNEFGKTQLDDSTSRSLRDEISSVPIPTQDPVSGHEGPLVHIWKAAQQV